MTRWPTLTSEPDVNLTGREDEYNFQPATEHQESFLKGNVRWLLVARWILMI